MHFVIIINDKFMDFVIYVSIIEDYLDSFSATFPGITTSFLISVFMIMYKVLLFCFAQLPIGLISVYVNYLFTIYFFKSHQTNTNLYGCLFFQSFFLFISYEEIIQIHRSKANIVRFHWTYVSGLQNYWHPSSTMKIMIV